MKRSLMAMGIVFALCMQMPAMEVQAMQKEMVSDVIYAKADTAKDEPGVDLSKMLSGVTEQITQALEQIDTETAEEIFDFIEEKISDGSLKTEEGLKEAIQEGEEKFDITVDEATAKQVVETMEKLEQMGFSGETLVEKAKELYEKYGADFMEHANEAVGEAVEDAVSDAVSSFFENIWADTKNFFRNLLSGF